MSNEHNIDKLLKESFDNFSPDAPDVWQAVQQGVQAAQASGVASSGAAATVQGVSLTVKIIAGIAIAAASVTGYLVYKTQANKDAVKTADPVKKEQLLREPEHTDEADQPLNEVITPDVPEAIGVQKPKQPELKSASAKPKTKVAEEDQTMAASIPVPETITLSTETKSAEQNTAPVLKETGKTEDAKNVTKVYTTDTSKGVVSKLVVKVSKEKPYDPYAEDGEDYEKPTIPGSISPNNDGLNDVFKIIIENETYYSLKILNEKGEIVFESKNKEQVWDGKHYKTGIPCAAGKYLYFFNYQYKGSEKVHGKPGMIELFL